MKPQNQNQWVNSSLASKDLIGRLGDDRHHVSLAIHDPLWRHVIANWYSDVKGKVDTTGFPIGVIGKDALSVGIELTQWSYPVTFIEDQEWKIQAAREDSKVQAGFFTRYLAIQYFFDVPPVCVYAFIGIIDGLFFLNERWAYEWLSLLTRRSREVIFAVRYDEKLMKWLENEFRATIRWYPDGRYIFVQIRG